MLALMTRDLYERAHYIMQHAARSPVPVAVYVKGEPPKFHTTCDCAADSEFEYDGTLVGVYDGDATEHEIAADLEYCARIWGVNAEDA